MDHEAPLSSKAPARSFAMPCIVIPSITRHQKQSVGAARTRSSEYEVAAWGAKAAPSSTNHVAILVAAATIHPPFRSKDGDGPGKGEPTVSGDVGVAGATCASNEGVPVALRSPHSPHPPHPPHPPISELPPR
jgi:hypothetical protein